MVIGRLFHTPDNPVSWSAVRAASQDGRDRPASIWTFLRQVSFEIPRTLLSVAVRRP